MTALGPFIHYMVKCTPMKFYMGNMLANRWILQVLQSGIGYSFLRSVNAVTIQVCLWETYKIALILHVFL